MKRTEVISHDDVLRFRRLNVNAAPMQNSLSTREKAVLLVIGRFQQRMYGAYGPTYAEIVSESGYTISEVVTAVRNLIKNGNLIKPYGKHRCFMIVRGA